MNTDQFEEWLVDKIKCCQSGLSGVFFDDEESYANKYMGSIEAFEHSLEEYREFKAKRKCTNCKNYTKNMHPCFFYW